LCIDRSACINTLSGFYCIPYLPSSKLQLIRGSSQSLSPVIILNNTGSGTIFSFEVYLGNGTTLTNVSYGTMGRPPSYQCLSFTSQSASSTPYHLKINCTLNGNGFGAAIVFSVQSCTPAGTCYWYCNLLTHSYSHSFVCLRSFSSTLLHRGAGNDSFSFVPPTISDGTLRLKNGIAGTYPLQLTSSFSTSIQFDGTGFSSDPLRMTVCHHELPLTHFTSIDNVFLYA
jgi:hypothetical protein